ncbi:NUDIX hydrolase [Carnobacterium sp.]|uniref:NUDIX hydrolase n=1 Tax=Carnobacterium sp. TaxID=48221 RepID=UPI002FC72A9E
MQIYTLCFLKKENEILLLNRQKNPSMGRWSGVGGKIKVGETPLECALREIKEETDISLDHAHYGEQMDWYEDGVLRGGLELYLAELPADFHYLTPKGTREGILDFKKIDWIFAEKNQGMPDNIPFILNHLLTSPDKQYFSCFFESGALQKVIKVEK